jgi:membrane fusion protein, multidrug efflux system
MNKNTIIGVALLAAAAGGYYFYTQKPAQTVAATPPSRPPVSVTTGTTAQKNLPVRIDSVGTVQSMANITLRPRVDSQILKIHVADGAAVKQGDLLVTLDSRQLDAQIKQAEGAVIKNKASLVGANREASRLTELLAKESTSKKALDDAKTKAEELAGQIKADEANVENLRVQLSFTEIRAPITGRLGTFPLKTGAIVRQGEVGMTLGNLIQTAPIYVAFGVPQRRFAEVRKAFAAKNVTLEVTQIGTDKPIKGELTVLDNTIDTTTGNVILRATFANADEALWPGALVNVRLSLGADNSIVVPSSAVQNGQVGEFVFVIKDNKAEFRRVKSGRTLDNETVVETGLQVGDIVVLEGQIALNNGAPVVVRNAGGGGRPPGPPPAAKVGG